MSSFYMNGGNANWDNGKPYVPVYDEEIKTFPCTFTSQLARQPGGYTLVVGIVGHWIPSWLEGYTGGAWGNFSEWWGSWN